MPRDFESGNSNRIGSTGTGWAAINFPATLAALCTVESLPGSGTYRYVISLSSGTAANQLGLFLDGDNSGGLALRSGSSTVVSGAPIVPPTDKWLLLAVTKASGTATPNFYMYRFDTAAWTTDSSGNTIGDRTAASATLDIGSLGAASYWDGLIEIAAMWHNVALTQQQLEGLLYGPRAWYDLHQNRSGAIMDIRWSNNRQRDFFNPAVLMTTGTDPGIVASPTATAPRAPWS